MFPSSSVLSVGVFFPFLFFVLYLGSSFPFYTAVESACTSPLPSSHSTGQLSTSSYHASYCFNVHTSEGQEMSDTDWRRATGFQRQVAMLFFYGAGHRM